MITKTAPWDHQRRKPIKDELVKICPHDGARVVSLPPVGSSLCLVCRGHSYIYRLESEIANYRQTLIDYKVLEVPNAIEES